MSTVIPGFVVYAYIPASRKQSKVIEQDLVWEGKFITAIFLLAKRWGKPKCLANKWINSMCYIQTTEYYSVFGSGGGWTDRSGVKREHLLLWQHQGSWGCLLSSMSTHIWGQRRNNMHTCKNFENIRLSKGRWHAWQARYCMFPVTPKVQNRQISTDNRYSQKMRKEWGGGSTNKHEVCAPAQI